MVTAWDAESARALWDQRYADAGGDLWGKPPNRFVEQYLDGCPVGDVVDLACGDGRNAVWLAGRGHTVTGVDLSPVALEQVREQAHQLGVEISTLAADLTDWVPPVASFDVVIHSFLHLPQPHRSAVLRAAAAALRPGGMLVLVAHPVENLDRGTGGPPDPALLPTVAEVRADLAGMDLEACELVERAVDGADRPAIDLVVVAHAPA